MRKWIFEFATIRYFDGAWPQWFWDWLGNVTFVEAEYVKKGEEIPF